MSDEYTYYISTSYHVVNLGHKKVLVLENTKPFKHYVIFIFCLLVSDEANILP